MFFLTLLFAELNFINFPFSKARSRFSCQAGITISNCWSLYFPSLKRIFSNYCNKNTKKFRVWLFWVSFHGSRTKNTWQEKNSSLNRKNATARILPRNFFCDLDIFANFEISREKAKHLSRKKLTLMQIVESSSIELQLSVWFISTSSILSLWPMLYKTSEIAVAELVLSSIKMS